MPVTIKDIAREVGVAPSTVSRVMNGKGAISLETRERIHQVMEKLQYHPNSLARNFANGSTFAIGLVIDARDENTFANAFFNRSVFAMEMAAQNNGYSLLITNDHAENDRASPIEKLVFERKADGLILPPSLIKQKLMQTLRSNEFPFVVLGQPDSALCGECSWVDVNNVQGSVEAVRHLLSQGYERIAFVSGRQSTTFVLNRLHGYCNALEEQGFAVDDSYILECPRGREDAYLKAAALLNDDLPPDAFLCSDNLLAFEVMRAVKEKGLCIPKQIGVVTFDNYPIAEFTDPPLTVVDVDTFSLGEQAANMLLDSVHKRKNVNRQTLIATTLIPRKSTMRKGGLP